MLSTATGAQESCGYRNMAARECPQDAIDGHVREQFAKYGPLSRDREYFGFVYLFRGEIGSAVARGRLCGNDRECAIDTSLAAPLIPKGAKVLGEWHTHPQRSSAMTLSPDDVRGAYSNRHIRCYAAYYSQPDGDIYAWNPRQSLVPNAMASRTYLGNYAAARRLDASRFRSDD